MHVPADGLRSIHAPSLAYQVRSVVQCLMAMVVMVMAMVVVVVV